MKIVVLGAGSLGCVFGGLLAADGHEVLLVNRNQGFVDQLNRDGLTLLRENGPQTIAVRAATSCQGHGAADLILVMVKSFHTREAVAAVRDAVGPDTAALSLQNGLGHEEIIGELLGAERVLIGKTYVGGQVRPDGAVVAGTRAKLTHIGEPAGGASVRARMIAGAFGSAGLETVASDTIMTQVWDKLVVNVATGALSALTRLDYGGLYAAPEVAACAHEAAGEAMAVAEAAGVTLTIETPDQAWTMAGTGLPPSFKASMLQSLEKGSQTEIDFVNGAVVVWGDRFGVPTPVNRTLVATVKGLERTMATKERAA